MAVVCGVSISTPDGSNLLIDATVLTLISDGGNLATNSSCLTEPYANLEVSFETGSFPDVDLQTNETLVTFNFEDNEYSAPSEIEFNFTHTVIDCENPEKDGGNLIHHHIDESVDVNGGNLLLNTTCFGTCSEYTPANGLQLVLDVSSDPYTPEISTDLNLNLDCNLLPYNKLPPLLSVEFKPTEIFTTVFADCQAYRPEIGTELVLDLTDCYTYPDGYGLDILLNSDCYTLISFNFETSSAFGSEAEATLSPPPQAFIDINFPFGTDNSANIDHINVNLSETCGRATIPLNVNVCQEGWVVNYDYGSEFDLDLSIFSGAKFEPYDYDTGQELDVVLTQYDIFYPENIESGSETSVSLQRADIFYPANIESGQEILPFEVILPPRALLELDIYFGDEFIPTQFPNTFNLPQDCGQETSPLNYNLCSTKSFANIFFGSEAQADLFTVTGALLFPLNFDTGATVEFELARYFELDIGYESGDNTYIDFATYYQPVLDVYYGSELEELDITIPPRAFIESDNYFGSESDGDLSTTASFNGLVETGQFADTYLTPACITDIPLSVWRDGYWNTDCTSVNQPSTLSKFYRFTLNSTKEVTIDLLSTSDNVLYLLNGHGFGGSVITSDDNSGTGTNAQIVYVLNAGDYTVEAARNFASIEEPFQIRVNIPSPDIQNIDSYHGHNLDVLLSTQKYLEVEYNTGSELEEVDLIANPFDKLEVTYETASELSLFTLAATHALEVEYETGLDSEVDLLDNPFDKLEVTYETGLDSDADLATTDLLYIEPFETGLDSEVDLLDNPFDKLEVTYETASEFALDTFYRAASFNCYCFYGSDSLFDLELAPSEGIGVVTAYSGAELELDEVGTEEFTIFNFAGSEVDIDLQTNKILEVSYESGFDAEVELLDNPFDKLEVGYEFGSDADFNISRTLGFIVEFDFGSDGETSIVLPPRAYLELDAYYGDVASLPETILNMRPMQWNVGLDFNVKHNHCESCCDNVDPVYGDSTIRVDELDFDFSTDNFKDDYPWTICDSYEVLFESSFQTNPRFVINFEVEATSVIAYIPQEYTAFIDGVPPEMLYLEHDKTPYHAEFEVEFAVTTGAWTWGDDWTDDTVFIQHSAQLSIELADTRLLEMYSGASFEVTTLNTEVPEWRTDAFKDMSIAAGMSCEFELIDYIRFCPGYILPSGNQVNFEFYGVIDTGCNVEWMYFGDTLDAVLEANPRMTVNFSGMARMSFTLYVEPPMRLHAIHGAELWADLATDVKMGVEFLGDSSRLTVTMLADLWSAGHSTATLTVDLAVPGPDIIWFTSSGCLDNEYVALTDDGDIDYLYYQPDETQNFLDFEFEAVVENKQFKHALDARCFKAGSE